MSKQTRRKFLKQAGAASAAVSLFTISGTKSSGDVIGANDRLQVAVVGCGGRGKYHIGQFAKMKGTQVRTIVEVDTTHFALGKQIVAEAGGAEPACVEDIRTALDDKNIDAISIATPNHTHSLFTIWGCQAGKDVYVEKPISHNVWEGRKVVEAANKYGRVVQHGAQRRSQQSFANEISAIHSGNYGKLLVSKGYCCKPRWSIDFKKPKPAPKNINFDMWLGPAPEQPYHENLVHYNWHWFWDFGAGDVGNQGVHQMDVARWAIPGATLPTKVWSLGGRFGYEDQGETPNMLLSVYEFGDVLLVFETRGLVGKNKGYGRKVENEYFTTEGRIAHGKFYPNGGGKPERVKSDGSIRVAKGGPFGSFVNAVKSRNPEDNNSNAEVGHYSSSLCHMGNISYRLGEQVPFNSKAQSLGDNKQVVESWQKVQANCKAVGMNLSDKKYQLGRTLEVDPKAERFVNDDQANLMLTREYRKPYEITEEV